MFSLRPELALNFLLNIFLPKVNSHITVPYLIRVNLDAFLISACQLGAIQVLSVCEGNVRGPSVKEK